MRVAFVIWPASAHLFPLVNLAWAFRSAGHEVTFVSHPSISAEVTSCGLPFMPLGRAGEVPPPKGPALEAPEARAAVEEITQALGVPDEDRDRWNITSHGFIPSMWDFIPYGASPSEPMPLMDNMVAFFRNWRPDLVLWDPCMPGAAVAARAAGTMQARIYGTDYMGWFQDTYTRLVSLPGAPKVPSPLAETVRGMAEKYDVTVDHDILYGQFTVEMMPPGMDFPVDTRKLRMRWVPFNAPTDSMPDWLYPVPDRPRVALSLGVSIRSFLKGDWSFTPILLEGLGDLDVEVVATLNADQVAPVGTMPSNVRVVDYVPLDYLVPTCSLLIHHGGLGTMTPAAYHGVPQMIVDFSDQRFGGAPLTRESAAEHKGRPRYKLAPVTGGYVTSFGAGEIIDLARTRDEAVDAIREQVTRVLKDPSYTAGAARLRRDLLASPAPTDLVPTLEKLAQGG
jgi:glycosyltransferase